MGTTPKLGLPYPEPTDPVAAGANAIRDLALALDAQTPRIVGRVFGPGADQNIPANSATIDVTGMTLTWTAVAGRRYRLVWNTNVTTLGASAAGTLAFTNQAGSGYIAGSYRSIVLDHSGSMIIAHVETVEDFPTGGSVTRKCIATANTSPGGELILIGTYTRNPIFYVEDVGPI